MDLSASHPAPLAKTRAPLKGRFDDAANAALKGLALFTPLLDFGIRLLVASVFFQAGLTKIASWSSTLTLFEYEYAVPLLPPELAAWLGTAAELSLPVLLVLGLGTRLAALALFLFNIVAVISYPGLGEVGLQHHQYWGLLLLVTLCHGPGKLSLDHLIRRWRGRRAA
ncbi:DoxX family protein [Azotobacter chroococcum]|jgi:putative oxidoreductase|uniref:Putative oxidoreductase n=1 Tax=Azotobacter chroococcum TaxID=353 RepID=A0A4R1PNL4_9GAMM|nr:DoxX family protein [Azotobacter chroococcum]TBV99289.1 DoxX family protein [Azotobacter chroococcum]TCL29667.1 putative oxidoreductase [Azotobacter chroococcum]